MTPIVLLHGALGAPSSFDEVRARLDRSHEVCAPWLPGHGPSRAPLPETFELAAAELAREVPRGALLVGYSLGGRLALALARAVACAGLVLVGAHAEPGDDARRAWDDEQAAAARLDFQAFVASWERLPVFATQSDDDRARQRATRLSHDGARVAWALSTLGQGRMPDLSPTLAAQEAPTRWLVGERDARLVASARRARLSPAVRLTIVPDRGHNLILEAPAVVAAAIESVHKELS